MTVDGVIAWVGASVCLAWFALQIAAITGLGVSFHYSSNSDVCTMACRLFGRVPIWTVRMPLEQIAECRPFDWSKDFYPIGWLWGVLLRPWWTVVLVNRRAWGFRRMFITPTHAEGLALAKAVELRKAK